jgi:hypothetical protein
MINSSPVAFWNYAAGSAAVVRAVNRSTLTGHDVLWNEMFGLTPSSIWPYWR